MTDEELDQPATKRFVRDAIADAVAPLATKEEIARLATKEELARLATKEEIAKLATKEEIALLATRAEMELGFARLMEAILEVQRSVHIEVRTAIGITEEEWQRRVAVLDEKYKDLPPRVSALEDHLEAHERDFRLHKRPRVT